MLHLHQVLHGVKIIPGQEGNVMEPYGTLPRTLHGGALTLVCHSAFAQFKYEEMLLGWLGRMTVGTVTAGLNGLLFFSGRQLGHTVLNESRFWMCILFFLQIVPFCLQSLHKPKRSKKAVVGHFLMSFTLFLFLHYSLGHLCKHIRHSPAFS